MEKTGFPPCGNDGFSFISGRSAFEPGVTRLLAEFDQLGLQVDNCVRVLGIACEVVGLVRISVDVVKLELIAMQKTCRRCADPCAIVLTSQSFARWVSCKDQTQTETATEMQDCGSA